MSKTPPKQASKSTPSKSNKDGARLVDVEVLPAVLVNEGHATYGSPSSLKRTEQCPGWIAFGRGIAPLPDTDYSKEGTCFHSFIEPAGRLHIAKRPESHIETALRDLPRSRYPDMEGWIWNGMRKLTDLWERFAIKHVNCNYYFELKVAVSEDVWGTADVVFTGKNRKTGKIDVVVIDWKYGQGVLVKAEENLQIIAYVAGAVATLGLKNIGKCVGIIAQLRLDDEWQENRFVFDGTGLPKYVSHILGIVRTAKELATSPKSPPRNTLKGGEWCKFCKCAPICPAQKEQHFDSTMPFIQSAEGFATEKPEARKEKIHKIVKKMSLAEQVEIFKRKSLIEDFVTAVAQDLHRQLEAGFTHKDLKLIKTSGRRAWNDEDDQIAAVLKERGLKNPWTKSLVPLTTAEKHVDIEGLTECSSGRTQVVLKTDRRQSVTIQEPDDFE